MIIAIDGPAASGKGTLGKRLAAHYGFRHLDTGLIYRAVARAVIEDGSIDNSADAIRAAQSLDPFRFSEDDLKADEVGTAASVISVIPEVRAALLAFQRDFAKSPPGAVLDGRDIGTVIAPEAEVKIFITADPKERARRRAMEMRNRGQSVDDQAILADIVQRDERDMNRAVAPLKPASDAHLLDTTHLDIDAAVRAAIDIVEAVRAGRGRG